MALVKTLEQITMERNSVHGEVEATYCWFSDDDGQRYLQIDTFGSKDRENPGKQSQSIQLGPEGLAQLRDILNTS